MKILFASILSGFLFISVSAFAADEGYTQRQNRVDDRDNAPSPYSSQSDRKSEQRATDTKSGSSSQGSSSTGTMGTPPGAPSGDEAARSSGSPSKK
ncbi:hypothetical protein SAMN05428977_105713 [Nitrosomonas sp. Nm166]|nr:hypothetical protein SAMN05428977_105713 [Nitrosomonas sp. Nm166]